MMGETFLTCWHVLCSQSLYYWQQKTPTKTIFSTKIKKGNSTLGRVNQKTVASGLYFIIPATENNWQCYPDSLLFCVVNIVIFLARDLLIISSVDGKQWPSCQHHLSSLLIWWYRYAQPLLQNIFSLECFLQKLDTLDYNTH